MSTAQSEPPRGRPGSAPSLSGHRHLAGQAGMFDETERRVPWEELAVARLLVAEGHHVRALDERGGHGRRADFEVCGVRTEVKTLDPGATPQTVVNALLRATKQGEVLIVNAMSSGLSRRLAEQGVRHFAEKAAVGRVGEVRILGAGFALAYSRGDLGRLARRRPPERGLGW